MKWLLLIILPCILTACMVGAPIKKTATATTGLKLLQLTAEAETVTTGYPKNDATITAILASKYAGGTAMAETMTAKPTETPIATIPPDSPFCHPADLKVSFQSMGATQSILLGGGLTNASKTPCFLLAWPQVMLVDQQGRPLDLDYTYYKMGPGEAASAATEQARDATTARVGIWPGWSTWLNLIWRNWCGAPISGGAIIRLKLWDNTGTIDIPTDLQSSGTCNAPGYRSTISIGKFLPAMPPQ
jgi:hypothetical protein